MMTVIFCRIKVIIVNVHSVADRDGGARPGFIVMTMSVFKHHVAFGVVDMAPLVIGGRWVGDVQALMVVSLSDPGSIDRSMIVARHKS